MNSTARECGSVWKRKWALFSTLSPLLCGILQAQNPANGAVAPPPGTKIEATLLSPPLPGASFGVSPLGIHMATLSRSGSRAVMLYDSVEGPKFDQIFGNPTTGGVAFSPDGSHYAYCGQQGNAAVVMEDVKEVWRSEVIDGRLVDSCGDMQFTSNSRHLYFITNSPVQANGRKYNAQSLVFDGQPNPPGVLSGMNSISFSPDGDHYTYLWVDPVPAPRPVQKLIIDGRFAPYVGGDMRWSADSKHLYSTLTNNGALDLLLDGKPIARANDVKLSVPPVGDMTVQLITTTQPPPIAHLLAVGNKPVPGSQIPGTQGGIQFVTISKDGKHYAAQYSTGPGQVFVFWDGKKGLTYRNLMAFNARGERDARYFDFTPDGRVVYLAVDSQAGEFLVVGDKESDLIRGAAEVVVSATGHVMANSMANAANSAGINLDGKYLQIPQGTATEYLGFSPDGNHYAFMLRPRDGNQIVFLDGVAQPNTVFVPAGTNTAFTFSPDSKHFAYFYRTANDMGVCLDGKCVSGGNGNNQNLTFSADSNHLFWVANGPRAFRLFVDGKPVLESGAPAPQAFPKETWQTSGPSGLIVFAHDNEGYKRISVTPSPQSSLASMR